MTTMGGREFLSIAVKLCTLGAEFFKTEILARSGLQFRRARIILNEGGALIWRPLWTDVKFHSI